LCDTAVQEEALQTLALSDLWGIAKRMAARLDAEGIKLQFALQKLGIAEDCREKVVEFVSHATGELANRSEPLGLPAAVQQRLPFR